MNIRVTTAPSLGDKLEPVIQAAFGVPLVKTTTRENLRGSGAGADNLVPVIAFELAILGSVPTQLAALKRLWELASGRWRPFEEAVTVIHVTEGPELATFDASGPESLDAFIAWLRSRGREVR